MKRLFGLVILADVVILVAVIGLLVGCGTPYPPARAPAIKDESVTQIFELYSMNIYRVEDIEARVVCWVFEGYNTQGGISCLPLSQTELDE